jgi:hypothetical protein
MNRAELLKIAKPTLFSTPMVQAILDDRKRQTRRVIKPRYSDSVFEMHNGSLCETESSAPQISLGDGTVQHKVRQFVPCKPRYQSGDILYVRETWTLMEPQNNEGSPFYLYRADTPDCESSPWFSKWRPSIHMPKEAARIFLRVTSVRAERLRQISYGDCCDEGMFNVHELKSISDGSTATEHYRKLWDALNAKRGYGWDTNPWVWVYGFERIMEA